MCVCPRGILVRWILERASTVMKQRDECKSFSEDMEEKFGSFEKYPGTPGEQLVRHQSGVCMCILIGEEFISGSLHLLR